MLEGTVYIKKDRYFECVLLTVWFLNSSWAIGCLVTIHGGVVHDSKFCDF